MTNANRHSAKEFIENLASRGIHHFNLDGANSGISGSPTAVRAALRRLKKKRKLAEPARGFFLVVPPEYRTVGCLPAEQFIPHLMGHWGLEYYAALLSAAELHGAAHQRPQVFQVMLRQSRRAVTCGEVRVDFVARKDLADTCVVQMMTPRGYLRVATPAATALELVGYYYRSGGLSNVATVLTELCEFIDQEALIEEARRSPMAWVQRLGYLLDSVGHADHAASLHPLVKDADHPAPLIRTASRVGVPRDSRWNLLINSEVEPDL